MNERTNTEQAREGGKERTAAARRTSREFQPGDQVILTHAFARVRGTVIGVVDSEVDTYRVSTEGVECVRWGEELTPIADCPDFVEAAVMDDEPLDLDVVTDEDALIAASLDAASLLVRICAADELPFRERVKLNGITWVVEAKPEQN